MKASLVAIVLMALLVLGLAAPVGAAEMEAAGSTEKGHCTLLLSGGGLSGANFDGNKMNIDVEAAHFCMDNVSLGMRQGLAYEDFKPGAEWIGSTALAADWYMPMERLIPYVGASVGYVYGDKRAPQLFLGPEMGVRKFLGEMAFVNLAVQYPFYYDRQATMSSERWGGRFEYSLGIGAEY